ncbi:MAG: NAD(P)H-dependent oxidoreductase [Rhodospirillales bacterium]|jgi:FMN-dependent NADH-azoreductase|nr:NAD(P)H-dependent oxidoreductase [Rhodospirillales bacterium]
MKTLLVMDTSPRNDSVSRQLTSHFIEKVSAQFPDVRVLHRDIGANPPEQIDDELINALRREPETLTDRQIAARTASDAMIAEMAQADAIVIGAPMHNFTITAAMRTWLDHVARPGKTFGYDPQTGPIGLLKDKPVYVLSTRGGKYGDGSPENASPADFQSGYLRHIFAFMGLKDVRIIAANGMDMGPEPRAEGIAEANKLIDAAVAKLAAA